MERQTILYKNKNKQTKTKTKVFASSIIWNIMNEEWTRWASLCWSSDDKPLISFLAAKNNIKTLLLIKESKY